jgi:hypothetical protein
MQVQSIDFLNKSFASLDLQMVANNRQKMEQQETKYPWHEAPEWAEWAATDSDGEKTWFEEEPFLVKGVWMVITGECLSFEIPNHKDSLESRPPCK